MRRATMRPQRWRPDAVGDGLPWRRLRGLPANELDVTRSGSAAGRLRDDGDRGRCADLPSGIGRGSGEPALPELAASGCRICSDSPNLDGRSAEATILPITFGFPFGLSVLTVPVNMPLPTKIISQVLPPIDSSPGSEIPPDVAAGRRACSLGHADHTRPAGASPAVPDRRLIALGRRRLRDLGDRRIERGVEFLVALLRGQPLGEGAGEAGDHAVVAGRASRTPRRGCSRRRAPRREPPWGASTSSL